MKKALGILTLVIIFTILIWTLFFLGLNEPTDQQEAINTITEKEFEQDVQDISEDIIEVPHYHQKDDAWRDIIIDDTTIGEAGDRVTALAMAGSYLLKQDITPDKVAKGTYMASTDPAYLEAFGDTYDLRLNDAGLDANMVLAALQFGDVAVAETTGELFDGRMVVIAGHTDEGYLILDPDSENALVVKDEDFLAEVSHMWIFA